MDWRPEFSSQGWCRPYAVKLLADINPVANLGALLFEKLEEFPYQENKENGCGKQFKKTPFGLLTLSLKLTLEFTFLFTVCAFFLQVHMQYMQLVVERNVTTDSQKHYIATC